MTHAARGQCLGKEKSLLPWNERDYRRVTNWYGDTEALVPTILEVVL